MNQREEIIAALEAQGLAVTEWTDTPRTTYGEHAHPRDEVLVVLSGEMRFAVGSDEHTLRAGDRLELPAGATHTAIVGPAGATYLVAKR